MRDSPAFHVLLNSRFKYAGVALLILLLDLLANLALLAARPGLFLQLTPEPLDLRPAPVSARSPTGTPYQPVSPTLQALVPASARLPATSTPLPGPSTDFYGIDFHPGAAGIQIILQPQTRQLNRGKPIVITVNPGRTCPYQVHRACVSAYRTGNAPGNAGNVIFVSVHSGTGGEAEAYRRLVEGIGVDQAGFSLKRIRLNLASLQGAAVQIQQGERSVDGLELAAAARVPAALVRDYFRGPVEQALRLAATVNPELETYTNPAGPILVFETCGWVLPGEPWAPGVTSTTGSVYVGVIQRAP